MELPCITIGQLRDSQLRFSFCYRDDLLITDRIEAVERFRLPCRIYAVTLLVCISGETECVVNLTSYRVRQNTVAVCFPDDIIQIKSAHDLDAYAILISPTLLDSLNLDYGCRSDFYLRIREKATFRLPQEKILPLKPYYTLLRDEMENATDRTPEIIRGLLSAFSYSIFSRMRYFQQSAENAPSAEQSRNKQIFKDFMALVKRYHTRCRGVKFYADKLCLTPNYLSGVIREYTGKTATEWVNDFVILEAKIMLKDTDYSVQEISNRLHFPDQSTFGKYFKKIVGASPKQYRENK